MTDRFEMLDDQELPSYPAGRVGGSLPIIRDLVVAFVSPGIGGAFRTRSSFPAAALAEAGWKATAVPASRSPAPGSCDVLILHRPHKAEHLALVRAHLRAGAVVLVQEDDDLTAVPSGGIDRRIKATYTPQVIARHDQAISEADGLIVSTPRLAEVYGPLARRTWVVRNYLPRWIGDMARTQLQPVVAWGGRVATHKAGLDWIAPVAKRMLEGAEFLTVGDGRRTVELLGLDPRRCEFHAYETDVKRYYRALAKASIGIVPLVPTEALNLAKSALKGQEHFALGQPIVAARTPEYEWLVGAGGFLADTPEEFAEHVQSLIRNPELRADMARAARARAGELWIDQHVGEWEAVLGAVRDMRRERRESLPPVSRGSMPSPDDGSEPLPVLRRPARRAVDLPEVPTVVVALPTRGSLQSRTVEALLVALDKAVKAKKVKLAKPWWTFAHGRPIPESHETAAEQALATGADVVWFIEEDNVPPAEALIASVAQMRESGAGVVAVPYPVGEPPPAGTGTRWSTIYREGEDILFTGLGITLVARQVFETMPRPWFRIDKQLGKDRRLSVKKPYDAGGVDVSFGVRAREAGFALAEVKGMVGAHIRTVKKGTRPFNNSPDDVEIWDSIDRDQLLFRGRDKSRFVPPRRWDQEFRRAGHASPWVGRFLIDGRWYGNPRRDAYDPVHDPRVTLCRTRFPEAKQVLELGCLEGGHTVAISHWAENVVALEGRESNLRKARLILQANGVENAHLHQANLETVYLDEYGSFDLVFSVGVLYHMTNPVLLLDKMRLAARALFLWTHHSEDEDGWEYREGGLRDPLSGLHPTSTWLSKARLMHELESRYDHVILLNEDEKARPRPSITVAAWSDDVTQARGPRES